MKPKDQLLKTKVVEDDEKIVITIYKVKKDKIATPGNTINIPIDEEMLKPYN